jgi:hypothetical protein
MEIVWGLREIVEGVDCIGQMGAETELLNLGGTLMRRALERGSDYM